MKKLFTRSFVRAIIITVIAASIIAGGVYAYETLWSGKAHITIEPPSGEAGANIEILQVEASSNSNYDNVNDLWTVSIQRAEMAQLRFTFRNSGDDASRIVTYINGEEKDYKQIATGVFFHGIDYPLAAGAEVTRVFIIEATLDAEAGEVPEIQLELKAD